MKHAKRPELPTQNALPVEPNGVYPVSTMIGYGDRAPTEMSPNNPAQDAGLISFVHRFVLSGQLAPSAKSNTTMWHNLVWIGGIWLVVTIIA